MQVFRELSVDSWSSVAALNTCIGNIDEDEENSIMQAEMASQRGGGDTGEASHLCFTYCWSLCCTSGGTSFYYISGCMQGLATCI